MHFCTRILAKYQTVVYVTSLIWQLTNQKAEFRIWLCDSLAKYASKLCRYAMPVRYNNLMYFSIFALGDRFLTTLTKFCS